MLLCGRDWRFCLGGSVVCGVIYRGGLRWRVGWDEMTIG